MYSLSKNISSIQFGTFCISGELKFVLVDELFQMVKKRVKHLQECVYGQYLIASYQLRILLSSLFQKVSASCQYQYFQLKFFFGTSQRRRNEVLTGIYNGLRGSILFSQYKCKYILDIVCIFYKINSIFVLKMLKAFKYRISPTKAQAELINKHIGSCRFVYNLALETKQTAYVGNKVNLSCFDLVKQLPELKKECEWLKEINSQSLQQSIINLDKAFTTFFKGQNDFPNFKKKTSRQSFNVPANVELLDGKLSIPKFKKGIDIILHREIKGTIRQATISKTPTGKYFASILCETNTPIPSKKAIKEKTTVGIDLGIKSFVVSSDGAEFDNPKHLKNALSKLKYVQRKYSVNKGKRTKKRLAKLHERVANRRMDFLHKTSSDLIKNHDSIAIEDLNIKGMVKNHKLAGAISDAGWGTFVTMLEYKAEWYGKNILRIGRFEPSSKMCSCCGRINKELTLQDREWTCVGCGTLLKRDVNAAINIKTFALKNHLSAVHRLKNRNELPTLVGVLTYEAPSPSGKG